MLQIQFSTLMNSTGSEHGDQASGSVQWRKYWNSRATIRPL